MADRRLDRRRPDRDHAGTPDPTRGLHVLREESFDEFVADLLADVLEGLELRLTFEAWADERQS